MQLDYQQLVLDADDLAVRTLSLYVGHLFERVREEGGNCKFSPSDIRAITELRKVSRDALSTIEERHATPAPSQPTAIQATPNQPTAPAPDDEALALSDTKRKAQAEALEAYAEALASSERTPATQARLKAAQAKLLQAYPEVHIAPQPAQSIEFATNSEPKNKDQSVTDIESATNSEHAIDIDSEESGATAQGTSPSSGAALNRAQRRKLERQHRKQAAKKGAIAGPRC